MNLFDIAEIVRSKRKERGWTQKELSRRIGISRQRVTEFENGNLDEIGFTKVLRMLVALKLEMNVDPIGTRRRLEEDGEEERLEALRQTDEMVSEAMRRQSRGGMKR